MIVWKIRDNDVVHVCSILYHRPSKQFLEMFSTTSILECCVFLVGWVCVMGFCVSYILSLFVLHCCVIVNTSRSDCHKRHTCDMPYSVFIWLLNSAHSLTEAKTSRRQNLSHGQSLAGDVIKTFNEAKLRLSVCLSASILTAIFPVDLG